MNRDEFAIGALTSLVSRDMLLSAMYGEQIQNEIASTAALAYRLADAMILAREGPAAVLAHLDALAAKISKP